MRMIKKLFMICVVLVSMVHTTTQGMIRERERESKSEINPLLLQVVDETIQREGINFQKQQTVGHYNTRDTTGKFVKKTINVVGFAQRPTINHISFKNEYSNYRCTECEYNAPRSSSLKNHYTIHNLMKRGLAPTVYRCQVCNYLAVVKKRIKEHAETHTKGITPYINWWAKGQ